MLSRMNQRGQIEIAIIAILAIAGIIFSIFAAIIGADAAAQHAICSGLLEQYGDQKSDDGSWTMCSQKLNDVYVSLTGNGYMESPHMLMRIWCSPTGLFGTYQFNPEPESTDCEADGLVCIFTDNMGNPVPDHCGIWEVAGIEDVEMVASASECSEGFTQLGVYLGSDELDYKFCFKNANSLVEDLNAYDTNGVTGSACPEGFVSLEILEGADGKEYEVCKKTGNYGVEELKTFDATAGGDCTQFDVEGENPFTLLGTFKGPLVGEGEEAVRKNWAICLQRVIPPPNTCECKDPLTNECGTDLLEGLDDHCREVCENSEQAVGNACTGDSEGKFCDPDTSTCIGAAEIPCGTTQTVGLTSVRGVQCPAGEVCRLDINPNDPALNKCISVTSAVADAKYEFDLTLTADPGQAINACYIYNGVAEDESIGIDSGKKLTLALGGQASREGEVTIPTTQLRVNQLGKGGVLPFMISAGSGISGKYNYALVSVRDSIAAADGTPTPKEESFIFKLNAPIQGACYSESGLIGTTGQSADLHLQYNWSFSDSDGIKIDSCDEKKVDGVTANPDYFFCDSTQFSIELSKKVAEIIRQTDAGTPPAFDSPLRSFSAYLLPDGYGSDFRMDFNFLQQNAEFFTDNAAFIQVSPFFNATDKWVFQPESTAKPGKYKVNILVTFPPGKQNVFFEDSVPLAKIVVTMALEQEKATNNPLYWMPVDYRVGSLKRPGESAPNREGYGIGLDSPLRAGPSALIAAVNSNDPTKVYSSSEENRIDRLLESNNRGMILRINFPEAGQKGSFLWMDQKATPVMISIPWQSGKAEAFMELMEGETPIATGDLPIAYWSGHGSTLSNPCTDFHNKVLLSKSPEPMPGREGTCGEFSPNSKGFYWTDGTDGQVVFYKGMIYTPQSAEYALRKARDCTEKFQIVTPNGYANNSTEAVPLGFLTLNSYSLNEVIRQTQQGNLCMSISIPRGKTQPELSFYWNREKALHYLAEPFTFDGALPPYSQVTIGFTNPTSWTCSANSPAVPS